MNKNQYHNDKAYTPPHIPFFKKRGFQFSLVFSLILLVSILGINEYFREIPPKNLVKRIPHPNRETAIIELDPLTVSDIPAYNFIKESAEVYHIDIQDSEISYEYESKWEYGNILSTKRQQLENRISRITITLNNSEDSPDLSYDADNFRFIFKYNKHLVGKYIVVIDPGHGGVLPGAIGKGGTKEKDVTLDISLKLAEELKKKDDIFVIMTRDTDEDIDLDKRRNISNNINADFFISIHANSSVNRRPNHTEIYYSGRGSNGEVNRKLATEIKNNLQSALSIRGWVKRRGFYVIRRNNAKYGAVLVETMFISNKRGETMLLDDNIKNKIAKGISSSIDRMIMMQGN